MVPKENREDIGGKDSCLAWKTSQVQFESDNIKLYFKEENILLGKVPTN